MKRIAVIIVNFRSPALVVQALESLEEELDSKRDVAVVVDNASGDGSAEHIFRAIEENGWGDWTQLLCSEQNGGFSAGNNIGLSAVEADFYLLLNSDAYLRQGAIDQLLQAASQHPNAGLISPRLEWPDSTPQISCFRNHSPLGEFVDAASTRFVSNSLPNRVVPIPVADNPTTPDWTSFACVLIRREVVLSVGLLDDHYFMYFEDVDFCRRAGKAGWTVLNWPQARVVHLRGGSSTVKASAIRKARLPEYLYRSRARYFAKFYSPLGLWRANVWWMVGRGVSLVAELIGLRESQTCEKQWVDNWIGARSPLADHRTGTGSGRE
jgi:GT2 family glycosyltransferase